MVWAFARKPPAELLNVVTQDEFTHDIVIRVSPEVFLVCLHSKVIVHQQ